MANARVRLRRILAGGQITLGSFGKLLFAAAAMIVAAGPWRVALSQTLEKEPQPEWEKRQNPDERLRSYGPDILGDQIDPATGGITFEHTDVSLPGNSHLEVALRRRISQGYAYNETTNAEFGDWEYLVPRITVVSPLAGWTGNRCSSSYSTTLPPIPAGKLRLTYNFDYSQGVTVEEPGYGSQQLLEGAGGAQFPVGQTHATPGGWYFTCITASDGGQGFLGRAPNGDVYRFDRYILMPYTRLGSMARGKQGGAQRTKAILAATRVTDVSGNFVDYTYDASGRLTRIEANDGRRIDLTYSGASALVAQVTANPTSATSARTWTYAYRDTTYLGDYWDFQLSRKVLSTVTQPDGRAWSFQLDAMAAGPGPDECVNGGQVLSLTHPYGVTGSFGLGEVRHRQGLNTRMIQALECPTIEPEYGTAPPVWIHGMTDTMSVTSKTLAGPGMTGPLSWAYAYEEDFGPLGSSSGDQTNWTQVAEPGGTTITYYHYWQDHGLGGKLARKEVRQTFSASPLETATYTFSQESGVGLTFARVPPPAWLRTLDAVTTTTRDGDTFTTANTYDSSFSSPTYSYGYPTQVTETSSTAPGISRIASTVYAHNKTKWILGLPSTVTRNGKLFDSYTYDSFGRVLTHSKFGGAYKTYTYHTTGAQAGQINTATDANNHVYTLTNWKRGQPQTVTRPGGTVFSRVVDDNGWVTSETDPNGNVTGFTYNTMGWFTGVDYPGGYFASMSVTYSGLGTGVQETRTRGNRRNVISYDGMLRPTLVKSESLGGEFVPFYEKMSYDIFGRETFKSWPSTSASPVDGVTMTYDALSRPLATQETVSPYATTTTTYLAGGRTRVTDPSGAQVTTTNRAFGSPANNPEVMEVVDAMGATTTMTRDIYGNIVTLAQSGTQNGFTASVTRNFWYDGDLRLCRHRAPEFGDEVFVYDEEDRLIESGRGASAATTCLTSVPSGIRVTRGYDVLDRETSVTFPSGTPAIARTFDNNGNALTVNRGTGTNDPKWAYIYNVLDTIAQEKLTIDGRTYTFDHAYTTEGSLQSRANAHSGLTLEFDPDALGRPRSARVGTTNYISGATYHPNGVISWVSFGNGHYLNQSLDARQRPYNRVVAKPGGATAQDLYHYYDARGKLTTWYDVSDLPAPRAYTYDANGRLLTASGPWGQNGASATGSFKYDALGNIREQKLGTRTIAVNYAATTNRVSAAVDNGATKTYGYDARGNATGVGAYTFTYDHSNQPVTVTVQGTTHAAYGYDGNLKRVKEVRGGKTYYNIFSKVTGGLLYRDQATDVIKTDYVTVGGAALRLKKTGTGAPVPEYTHFDSQGSAIAATNAAGTITWRERYAPFGEELLNPAANADNTGYTGHLKDDSTGLNYMQARYYDPIIGRFLSTDPIGYQDQLNLYAYVGNDPVNMSDPNGEQGAPDFIQDQRNAAVAAFSKDNPKVAGAFSAAVVVAVAIAQPEIGLAIAANAPALTEATAVVAEGVAPGAGAGTLAGALMNGASKGAIARATEGITDSAPKPAAGGPTVTIGSNGDISISGASPVPSVTDTTVSVPTDGASLVAAEARASGQGERLSTREGALGMVKDAMTAITKCVGDACPN